MSCPTPSLFQLFYEKLTSLENIKTYLRDVRKPRNDDTYIKSVAEVLGR